MLEGNWQASGYSSQLASPDSDREFISISDITGFLRKYFWSISACVAAGVILAWFYITTTDPTFTARTQIIIEPKLPQFLQPETGGVNTSLDTAQIESQITVMRSEKIAKMVIDDLELMDDPAFLRLQSPSVVDRLQLSASTLLEKVGIGSTSPPREDTPSAEEPTETTLTEFELTRLAIAIFQGNLDIRRVGVSYAVDIHFRSHDPELAARIANSTAETFVREQIETKAAAARQGGEWMETRLGELRTQMNTATQIAQEFRARHDYRVQPPGAEIIDGQLVFDEDHQGGTKGPTLEELEVTADTYRKMYESFLAAFTSNLSQQSYPVADARVITPATRPLSPTRPRRKLVLAFGIVAGGISGVGLSFARHMVDRSIRSPRQVREEVGLECLGELPAVRGRNGGFGLIDEVVNSPKSEFTESLLRTKSAINLATAAREPLHSIGVVSGLPGEGKSMCASNLALLYAMCGKRTLLVDADVDHAVLTTRLADMPAAGMTRDISAGRGSGTDIVSAANQCIDLLPGPALDARGLLSPVKLKSFLSDLHSYDLVIFDLPPLTSGADKLSISGLFDSVIIVAEWGKTPAELVKELAWTLHAYHAVVSGVVLTKVRMMSRKRYRYTRFHRAR